MSKVTDILHEGIVTRADGNSVSVLLSPEVACQGCKAGGSCSMAGERTKILVVTGVSGFNAGEKVTVSMKESQGYSALLLGYVYPLVILLATLFLCISLSVSELISGLISIAILGLYYLLLFALRTFLSKKFSFKILTRLTHEPDSYSDNNKS